METNKALEASSPLAWIVLNNFVTESRKPVEFDHHRFLIDYLTDNHPLKVTKKCSQVGLTVCEAFDNFWEAGHNHNNVIHTLQNSDVIRGFVVPKVDPLILHNPVITNLVTKNSEGLKQVGDNFIYFRGAQAESQAINISADVLKVDELDRSDARVAEMFESRLDFSSYKRIRKFSNPSAIGYGVDGLYQASNQFHWFITCHRCKHEWYIDFESDGQSHYVDRERVIYACGKCKKELSQADRIHGRWVAKYPNRTESHGYWFSQMMAPWFSAREVLKKYEENTTEYFYNFVLGQAYTPEDLIVNRETILAACSPSSIPKTEVALGVDNGVVKTWVLGTPDGIFAHGQTESWDEIEKLKMMYNAVTVIDPNPYPTTPKQLVDKYPGSVFICYFKQDTKNLGIVQWGSGVNASVVYADRTKLLDLVAQEITDRKTLFRQRPNELEDYMGHWNNLYRTTVETEDGRVRSTWLKKGGKMSDYPFAHAYYRIALARLMGTGGITAYAEPGQHTGSGYMDGSGFYNADLSEELTEAMEQ